MGKELPKYLHMEMDTRSTCFEIPPSSYAEKSLEFPAFETLEFRYSLSMIPQKFPPKAR